MVIDVIDFEGSERCCDLGSGSSGDLPHPWVIISFAENAPWPKSLVSQRIGFGQVKTSTAVILATAKTCNSKYIFDFAINLILWLYCPDETATSYELLDSILVMIAEAERVLRMSLVGPVGTKP